jgi:acyl carrier protein
MIDAEVYQRVTAVLRDVFDDDALVATPALVAKDVDGWDSLAHIRVIVALEQEFNVSFSAAEASNFGNMSEVVASIQTKGGR